jgi:hypothetical protein
MTAIVSNISLILERINGTDESQSEARTSLKKVHDILIIVLLFSVMFAVGCSITFKQVSLIRL